MELWYPEAVQLPESSDGGEMRGGPSRGVFHTTETSWWAGAPYYHIEYRPGFGWRQYRPFNRAARGLRHPKATPQTNRQGDYCIQVAVANYAKNTHLWGEKIYDDLGRFVEWCNAQFGITPTSRFSVGLGGEAYGVDGDARMLWDEWEGFNGWCGHQEVPANTHWDAGKVDWVRLLGDDVPQFTEEEARQLRNLVRGLKSLEPEGSGWGFATQGVELIRKERQYPLETLGESGVVDEVARTGVAANANSIKDVKETLRSV